MNTSPALEVPDIWTPVLGTFLLVLGTLLLAEEMLRVDISSLWGLAALPFAVGYLLSAYPNYAEGGLWQVVTSVQFFIGTAIAHTVFFTLFDFNFSVLWPVYIILAAVPTLFRRRNRRA